VTDRLYYDDSYACEFDATVLRTEPRSGATAVWLDRTAFYPTSGGQPSDVGTLDSRPVIAVEEHEGSVVHLVGGEKPLDVSSVVHGSIDWPRRFDHMQQHTGQHVLSAVIAHAFGARTVGFHLGTEVSTIDLDRELDPHRLARAERDANGVVWEDTLVSIRYATDEEAKRMPLRKESERSGMLRLIEIGALDLSACGGTHVGRTGAIGHIAIAGWERFKGGQRVEFLCGSRALVHFQQLRDATASAVRLLSVLPRDLPGAIERLQGEVKEQKKMLAAMQTELAQHEAAALTAAAEPLAIGRAVLKIIDGDATRLRTLAAAIVGRTGDAIVVLVSSVTPCLAVVARGSCVALPCDRLVTALVGKFGGRGGGKPDLSQCGGLQASPADVLNEVRVLLASPIPPET
jgi:alanyl-tRNA synthetase